jgi:putative MATE family efflux protein
MMASLFMGIGSGAMIMVSQYFGAQDTKKLRCTIDSVYTALIVGSIPLTLIGVFATDPILNLLNTPKDMRAEAYIYLVIVMAGLIGSLGFNLNSGILQGLGDSKTPLLLLAIACGLNIVLDLVFVLVIPLGVAGVAIATIIAQAFSWIFGIFYINKKYPEVAIHPFVFKFDKSVFLQVLRLGLPAGVQQALFSFAVIIMTRLVNGYGSIFAAGYSAASKLDAFVFLPINSICMAATTFTGQNIGAKKPLRVKQGARSALLISIAFSVIGLVVLPLGPILLSLFTDDMVVINSGMSMLYRLIPFYGLLAVSFTLNSVMRGAGEAIVPMLASIVGMWLARVPIAYLFSDWFGRDNMYFCYAFGWVAGLVITIPFYYLGSWRRRRLGAC